MTVDPMTVGGQSPERHSIRVHFQPGDATHDGYAIARTDVTYSFLDCAGDVHIAYSADLSHVDARAPYWYGGKSYDLPVSMDVPRPEGIPFKGRVYGVEGKKVGSFNDGIAIEYAGVGCLGQTQVVTSMSRLVGPEASSDERAAALSYLRVVVEDIPYAFTSARAAAYIDAEQARQRQVAAESAREEEERVAKRKAAATSSTKAATASQEAARRSASATKPSATGADGAATGAPGDSSGASSSSAPRATPEATAAPVEIPVDKHNAEVAYMEWRTAEGAFASGDWASAVGAYERILANDTPEFAAYHAEASQRLSTARLNMAAQQTMELVNDFSRATGLSVGPYYRQSHFVADDQGIAGLSFARFIGAFDSYLYAGVGSSFRELTQSFSHDAADRRPANEHTSWEGTVGGSLPLLHVDMPASVPLIGGRWAPHVGYLRQSTGAHDLNLLIAGLMNYTPHHGFVRLDAIIANGTPRYGIALGMNP